MKKLVVALLAVCMAATIIGCGKKGSMDKDTLVMATNAEFAPYEYRAQGYSGNCSFGNRRLRLNDFLHTALADFCSNLCSRFCGDYGHL